MTNPVFFHHMYILPACAVSKDENLERLIVVLCCVAAVTLITSTNPEFNAVFETPHLKVAHLIKKPNHMYDILEWMI